jgi:steroid delta-isomerase-like uncharacterized protein
MKLSTRPVFSAAFALRLAASQLMLKPLGSNDRRMHFTRRPGVTMNAQPVVSAAPNMNEAVVRRFFKLMDEHRFDDLEMILAPNLRFHFGEATMSRRDLVSMIRGFYDAFPDWQHRVEDVFSSGSRVVARAANRATHRGNFQGIRATGRTISIGQIAIYEVADGRIVEAWEQGDVAGLMAQISAP